MSALILAAALLVVDTIVAPSPAAAVEQESIAIGVGRYGDNRVLQVGGDGVSNSSPIVLQPYRQGAVGSVSNQRWTLVRQPAASGVPKFTYQIRHPATGKCLNSAGATPVNGAAVILYTCGGGTNEKWWMNETPGPLGSQFRNLRDGRCIDIANGSTANGVALKSWNCNNDEEGWNQYFGVKTGRFYCGYSTDDGESEGKYSSLCAEPAAPFTGLMASWHHFPVGIVSRASGAAPNEVRSSIEALTLNAQGSPHGTAYFGWKAIRPGAPTASVTYAGYWGEATADGFDYRTLSTVDSAGNRNGSDVGDGQQHTYMMLGNTAGEWDIFFDYNFEGSTRYQASNRAASAQVVLDTDFIDAVAFTAPYQYRARLLGTDGVWRRPRQADTATGTPKTCGGFPDSADITNGQGGNLPPWCLKGNRSFVGTGDALDVDVFTVEKPTSGTGLAAAAPTAAGSAQPEEGVVNGVDQQALARCLRADPQGCLQEVPGLAACVAARTLCNAGVTSPARQQAPERPLMGLKDAEASAVAHLTEAVTTPGQRSDVAVGSGTVVTAQQARRQFGANAVPRQVPDARELYLISGTGPVRGWQSGAYRVFHRWDTVIDPTTGTLLFAHLHNGS